jgi:hypothetical protein
MSGVWKRSQGRTSEAPPGERGGNRYVRPTATAPHSDSTLPRPSARVSNEGHSGRQASLDRAPAPRPCRGAQRSPAPPCRGDRRLPEDRGASGCSVTANSLVLLHPVTGNSLMLEFPNTLRHWNRTLRQQRLIISQWNFSHWGRSGRTGQTGDMREMHSAGRRHANMLGGDMLREYTLPLPSPPLAGEGQGVGNCRGKSQSGNGAQLGSLPPPREKNFHSMQSERRSLVPRLQVSSETIRVIIPR